MSKIKVSVIVPIYGVEKYLKEAVDSLLAQSLSDLEIILIDDGGKDNCPAIIDDYSTLDSRIIAIHKPNGGYGQTCNVGLNLAKGEYIAIMEPDDFIAPEMYKELYDIAKENDADIVKSHFYQNLDTPEHKSINILEHWQINTDVHTTFKIAEHPQFLYYHPSIWSCIYKREFLNKHNIRFKEIAGAGWTDNPFQVETMCLAERIVYTPKAYYYWRVLNPNASEELKNYKIPFDRCKDIDNWLAKNGINDVNVLGCYYKRKLIYTDIIFDKKDIAPKLKDIFKRTREIYKTVDNDIITQCAYLSEQDKTDLRLLKKNCKKYYYKRIGKIPLLAKLFSIKNETSNNIKRKCITIMGIKFKIKRRIV